MKKIALLTAVIASSLTFSAAAFAQSNPVATPQGIIVNPVQTTLQARVYVDRSGANPLYYVGENVKISVSVNQDAYVYLFSIDATGAVSLILPNRLSGGSEFMRGGETRQFPPAGANWTLTIEGNGGQEQVLAVASKRQLNLSEIVTFKSGQPFATANANVQGVSGLARPLALVVTPLPPQDWVTAITTYQVKVRSTVTAPPVPVVSNDPLVRFDMSLMFGTRVTRVIENKDDKFSAYVIIRGSYADVANYHQNQLIARGWQLKNSRIRNDSVRLEFRRDGRELEFRLERSGNSIRLTIEMND